MNCLLARQREDRAARISVVSGRKLEPGLKVYSHFCGERLAVDLHRIPQSHGGPGSCHVELENGMAKQSSAKPPDPPHQTVGTATGDEPSLPFCAMSVAPIRVREANEGSPTSGAYM